jgi:hypothetical protein
MDPTSDTTAGGSVWDFLTNIGNSASDALSLSTAAAINNAINPPQATSLSDSGSSAAAISGGMSISTILVVALLIGGLYLATRTG